MLLTSSTYDAARQDSLPRAAGRALANAGIAYVVAAVVTFVTLLVHEVLAPSEFNPHLGHALGGTFFVTALLLVGSPVVLAGAVLVDWLLRDAARPRAVIAILALIPTAFWLLIGANEPVALVYAAWSLLVGLGIARLMRLPPRST